MKLYIRSMSESQCRIYDKLADRSWEIDKHIVKLLLLPDCQDANHWKREIVRFVDHVNKLSGNNKWPDAKFLKKCLSTHNDAVDALLYTVSGNLKEANQRDISEEDVRIAIEAYQDWLARELSTHGAIRYDDAYAVLDEIIDNSYRKY